HFTMKYDLIRPLMPEVDTSDLIQSLSLKVDSLKKVDYIQPRTPEVDPMNTVILFSRLC
ncbi:hypothetical protein A2U01_0068407, partial [Trifolium medium]|nr:hypothetical protein [Trifolium medium]